MYRRPSVEAEVHFSSIASLYLGPLLLPLAAAVAENCTELSVAAVIRACPTTQTHRNALSVGLKVLPPQGNLWNPQFALRPQTKVRNTASLSLSSHCILQPGHFYTGQDPISLPPPLIMVCLPIIFSGNVSTKDKEGLSGPKAVLTLGWSSH